MNFWLWLLLFGLTSIPISLLLADRILGVPAAPLLRRLGPPWAVAYVIAAAYALLIDDPLFALLVAGAFGGLLGSIALDVLRIIGLRRGAFPLDMPIMFGLIALGLAPRLQHNLMVRMVGYTATLGANQRRMVMSVRLKAIAKQPENRRLALVGAMRAGLERLPDEQRRAVVETQTQVMAGDLDSNERRAMMAAMDKPVDAAGPVPHGPPRGLPRIPMAPVFQKLAEQAMPDTEADARVSHTRVATVGYIWHFLNGISFGIMYTLLVGAGGWGWAVLWGILVWAAMMVSMPLMMPTIKFPSWFPVVPFLAHIAMIIPFAAVALAALGPTETAASLLGALGLV